MASQEQTIGFNQNDFADISVKLRDIEEKQNMIKDRVLLIGENLVSEKQENENEILEIKSQLAELTTEIKKIKLVLERFIDESDSFARKSELETIKRQFDMFQPMNLARITDVENIVKREIKKTKQ